MVANPPPPSHPPGSAPVHPSTLVVFGIDHRMKMKIENIFVFNFSDPFILFSGGTCGSKKKGLTLMQGSRSLRVICTDTVVDFVCITSTPWGEGKESYYKEIYFQLKKQTGKELK